MRESGKKFLTQLQSSQDELKKTNWGESVCEDMHQLKGAPAHCRQCVWLSRERNVPPNPPIIHAVGVQKKSPSLSVLRSHKTKRCNCKQVQIDIMQLSESSANSGVCKIGSLELLQIAARALNS